MAVKGIFVTGTDTGVGKTVVASVIARILHGRGINAGVMKPVTSGCRVENGRRISDDAELLARGAGIARVTPDMAPYLLELPIAPSEAARREGITIDFRLIAAAFENLAARHDFVIVEGAGGLMAPLAEDLLVCDLVRKLSLPLLVVAGPLLGTVNHTILTCLAAKGMDIPVRGVIINNYPDNPGMAEETAPSLIAAHAGVPLIGIFPRCREASPIDTVAKLAERLADAPATAALLCAIGAMSDNTSGEE